MRIKTASFVDRKSGGQLGPIDITFTSPLILKADPTHIKHAATKHYVDSRLDDLDAGDLKTGVLPVNILPEFQGEVNNAQGTNVFNLYSTGVEMGVYPKVVSDIKGRVLIGELLTNNDIPELTWNKVYKNKPQTLSGYLVANALSSDGGSVGSGVTIQSVPVENFHVVNKSFLLDEASTLSSESPVGTVSEFVTDSTPEGFLRCNGGLLDKAFYPDLYEVLGYRYSKLSIGVGGGKPWENQYLINYKPNSSVTGWTVGSNLPFNSTMSNPAVTRNKVFVIGGLDEAVSSKVFSASIDGNGEIGNWVLENNLPIPLTASQLVVTLNRVYVIGGRNSAGSDVATVYTAPINQDGTLGNWTTGTSLPRGISSAQAVIVNQFLYVIGGVSGATTLTSVYRTTVGATGVIGAWTLINNLNQGVSNSKVTVTRNRLYVIGGALSTGTVTDIIQSCGVNSDGSLSTWQQSTEYETEGTVSRCVGTDIDVTFPGGIGVNTLPTEPIVKTKPKGAVLNLGLTIPVGGFITLEYDNLTNISGNSSVEATIMLPEDTKSIRVIGKGLAGNPMIPGRPYIPYRPEIRGPDTYEWVLGSIDMLEQPYPTHMSPTTPIPKPTREPTPGDRTGSWYKYVTTTNNPINQYFTYTPQYWYYDTFWYVYTRINIIQYEQQGQSYIPDTPATTGASSFVVYNGITMEFPGGTGVAAVNTEFTIPYVEGQNTIVLKPANSSTPITYVLSRKTGTTSTTFVSNGTVSVPATVDSYVVYGKGTNWLSNFPKATQGHSSYTSNNKSFIIGGTFAREVYNTSVDKCGLYSKWNPSPNLVADSFNSSIVATNNRLYLLGGSGSLGNPASSMVQYATLVKGHNDYSSFYNGEVGSVNNDPGKFALPDYTSLESTDSNYYIKY